jgi:hypothetical protein
MRDGDGFVAGAIVRCARGLSTGGCENCHHHWNKPSVPATSEIKKRFSETGIAFMW